MERKWKVEGMELSQNVSNNVQPPSKKPSLSIIEERHQKYLQDPSNPPYTCMEDGPIGNQLAQLEYTEGEENGRLEKKKSLFW